MLQARVVKSGHLIGYTVTNIGCITSCVEDALLVYTVMADHPLAPPIVLPRLKPVANDASLTGLKVGVYQAVSTQNLSKFTKTHTFFRLFDPKEILHELVNFEN